MNKKRIITLSILVITAAIMFGVYYFVSNTKFDDENNTSPVSTSKVLISENYADIVKLSFRVNNGDLLDFRRGTDGVWHYINDESFPVDPNSLNDMAMAISSVSASREIEEGNTGEFGLDDTALMIHAEFGSGGHYDLMIGNENSFNSSTYLLFEGEKVYMFSDSISEKFDKTLYDLIKLDDPEADVDTNYLDSIVIKDGSGNTNTISDTAGIRAAFAQSDVYDCLDWVKYAVSEADFAEYGINPDSARMIINYKAAVAATDSNGNAITTRVPRTYEIIFGNSFTSSDGLGNESEYVYYTVTGSTILYKISISAFNETMEYLSYAPENEDKDTETPDEVPDTTVERLTEPAE